MRRARRKVRQLQLRSDPMEPIRNRTPLLALLQLDRSITSHSPLSTITLHHIGILAKIDTLLAAAGTDKTKLISAQIWVKDISQHFKPMNKVWCAWLDPKSKPIRATVEANLALPDLLVEIQVTAAV